MIMSVKIGQSIGASGLIGRGWLLLAVGPLALRLWLALSVESSIMLLLIATPLLRFAWALFPEITLLSSVARDAILLLIYSKWLAAVFLRRQLSLPRHPAALIWLFALLWGGVQILRVGDPLVGLVAFRDWFRFVPLYFVVLSLLRYRPDSLKRLLAGMVIAGSLLAMLQLYVYIFIDTIPSHWFGVRVYRAIGPFAVPRMPTLIAGGPSGLGHFLASVVAIPLTYMLLKQSVPGWWRWGSLAMASVIVLTVSYTAWMALLCSAALAGWISRRYTLTRLILLLLLVMLFAGALGSLDAAREGTVSQYLAHVFFRYVRAYFFQSLDSALIGQGLSLIGHKTFLATDVQSDFIHRDGDSGWLGLAIHFGYPITLALVLVIVIVFVMAVRMIRRQYHQTHKLRDLIVFYAAAVPALLATLFSYHTLPWQRLGLDTNFFILFAAITVMGRGFVCGNEREAVRQSAGEKLGADADRH